MPNSKYICIYICICVYMYIYIFYIYGGLIEYISQKVAAYGQFVLVKLRNKLELNFSLYLKGSFKFSVLRVVSVWGPLCEEHNSKYLPCVCQRMQNIFYSKLFFLRFIFCICSCHFRHKSLTRFSGMFFHNTNK